MCALAWFRSLQFLVTFSIFRESEEKNIKSDAIIQSAVFWFEILMTDCFASHTHTRTHIQKMQQIERNTQQQQQNQNTYAQSVFQESHKFSNFRFI